MSSEESKEEILSSELKKLIIEGRENPEKLWSGVAEDLNWFKSWERVYEEEAPGKFRWFTGGKTNLSYNCLDYNKSRSVATRPR